MTTSGWHDERDLKKASNRDSHRTVLIVVGAVAVVVALVLMWWFFTPSYQGQLETEYSHITLPSTFQQTSATYNPGQAFDVAAHMEYRYSATGSRISNYTALVASLQNAGYQCDQSGASVNIDAASGYVTCKKGNFFITAQLLPNEVVALDNVNVGDPVTGAWLTLE